MQLFYTVQSGDTLISISRRWEIPLNSLTASNNLTPPYTIYPGQQLSMPPGINTYSVQPGDSIFSISQKYRISANAIINANGIKPPYIITPNQILTIPSGVPYYVVKPGDTLFGIARRYNVTFKGQPRPDYIIQSNPGITQNIIPGMQLYIPYPPPGGPGKIAYITSFDDVSSFFFGLYNPDTGRTNVFTSQTIDKPSFINIFWSPDSTRIAYADNKGIISVFNVVTESIQKIDQTSDPIPSMDWNSSGNKLVYSTGEEIRIYDIISFKFSSIKRSGSSYPQFMPNGKELLYVREDSSGIRQIFTSTLDGSNEKQITNMESNSISNVRLSPDGRLVLYTWPGASISMIYTIELTSGKTYDIPGWLEGKNYNPVWSPDSTRIAYSATHYSNGKYYSLIRVTGPKGEGDSTLAVSDCFSTPVTWSPDSRKIAYLSGCGDFDTPYKQMWSIDTTKPAPLNMLYNTNLYTLEWSPA
ncbi:MAG TPA: LysM peptidoglycan-binding domain-containing protein [Pseudobacteroides sp.]|uniref:LysM peptidoglycan-binding domain-containing protein n=1 Tax=Pseudobacteroides sp. TaxID=1968840 RepID=UPI002F93DE14